MQGTECFILFEEHESAKEAIKVLDGTDVFGIGKCNKLQAGR